MQLLDYSFDTPEENLACDEALLEEREENGGPGVLRFWESRVYFVVLGYTGKLAEEVSQEACSRLDVPVLRRCSGGGTVLQGPGCLNYSLIAPIPEGQSITGIMQTNDEVMSAQARALSSVLSARYGRQTSAVVRGHTDLAVVEPSGVELKFSGNAQRRKRSFFLFHGTFLIDFDLEMISKVLLEPRLQPEYRALRTHAEFVRNLGVSRCSVKSALALEWKASNPAPELPCERIAELVKEKYSRPEWNRRR